MKLSIIIPVYNEVNTIKKILNKVYAQDQYDKEVIIIDDFSTDGTREMLKTLSQQIKNTSTMSKTSLGIKM